MLDSVREDPASGRRSHLQVVGQLVDLCGRVAAVPTKGLVRDLGHPHPGWPASTG
jgi:hypothetical protein